LEMIAQEFRLRRLRSIDFETKTFQNRLSAEIAEK